jgi:hypothetical protein
LEPEDNWGTHPGGYDLTGFNQLRFRAHSAAPGSQVKFLVGGVFTGTYPSSIPTPVFAQEADAEGFVTLTAEWQEYHINLHNVDLSHVIGGFGWVAEQSRTPNGVTVFLDDIVYDRAPLPTPTPMPTRIRPPILGHPIYMGTELTTGYSMGVDTSGNRTDWVADMNGHICMAYPSGQSWGAVFVTVGEPTHPPRPGQDLSSYATLSLELRGEAGGEQVWVGIKDNTDPDNGRETKVLVTGLTTEWQTVTFPLSGFHSADLANVYVVTEFVFESTTPAETVCFRNIQYLP